MITQQTAADIWRVYREIDSGEKLLADIKAEREKPFADRDRHAPQLKDAFGRRQHRLSKGTVRLGAQLPLRTHRHPHAACPP